MKLTSAEVITIDSTVIVGLLVLMAFQSLSAPAFEAQYTETISQYKNLYVEHAKLIELLDTYCNLSDAYPNLVVSEVTYPENFQTDSFFLSSDVYFDTIDLEKIENSQCEQWKLQLYELLKESEGIKEWIGSIPVADNYEQFFENVTIYFLGGGLMVNTINLLLIIPFALSAIIESIHTLRKDHEFSSNVSVVIMLLGFAILILGISFLIHLMFCAVFVSWECPVFNYFPLS